MARPALLLAVAVTLAIVTPARPARSALTSDQGRCQRGAAAAGEKYLQSTAAILAQCHDAIAAGTLVTSDCRLAADSSQKLAKATLTLGTRLAAACTDGMVASLAFGGDCDGITTVAALVACIRSSHDPEVDEIVVTLYATTGELPPDPRKCQATASRQARAFAVSRMKMLRTCRNRAGKDKVAPGTLCSEEPTTIAKLAQKRAAAERKLATACGAAPLAGLDFGPPCAEPADAVALSECLLSLSSDSGDAASLALYGEGGFCGDAYQGVDGRVAALIAEMTLAEKVEQMHGSTVLPEGGVWVTPENERLGIPGFGMIDGPRGVSKIAGHATAFPVGIARGAAWDTALEERVGEAMGVEARAKGASVLLAPVTEVIRHPRWGRSQESYGEDPFHLGRMGVAFVRGVQRHVIASVKHFALNSIEDTRLTVSANVDERTLREIYLPQFRDVVEEGDVASVMSAYNRVNGLYCGENPHLLTDILKGDWKFRGFVESDWFDGTHSTIGSALAGLDLEMPFGQFYGDDLEDAVNDNDVPEATVDEAVRRILRAKLCFRLDSDPPALNASLVETPEHVALALEAARAGIVLLKNDGPVLPLDRGALTSIAVVGPLADVENIGDDGSSDVLPSNVVTALEGIVNRAGPVTVIHVTDPASPAGQSDISTADAAIVVAGFTEDDEGEQNAGAGDRDTYALPLAQEQLIADVAALNPSTIVVLEGGSAIGVESWIDDVEGLLMAWYPGMEGGNAIGDVLFGDYNPSGKLPLVVAKLEADLPPFLNAQNDVTYDYYHGYRLLDRDGIDPRFPFGYGLSYTTYTYSNLAVQQPTLVTNETLQVTFEVTNSGTVAGDEIAQLYVSYTGSAVDRPALDLKGFARVHLAPAETKTVSIAVPAEKLAYYDTGTSAWVVETITYGVHVGPSSRDLPLSASFMVQ